MFHLGLMLELKRWRAAGRRARLWWRDDDAATVSPQLERLLAMAAASQVPLTLAVIPSGDMAGLAGRLERAGGVTAVQHGVDHVNRRAGAAAGEFPHDWSEAEVTIALRRGWSLMRPLPRALMAFVPPWNDEHPQLAAALAAAGYAGWSASGGLGEARAPGRPARADAHLDLLRWRGGARFRGRSRFLGALAAELRRRRRARAWEAPIGLLTHHLAHDGEAWAFLAHFLRWSAQEPAIEWTPLIRLLGLVRLDSLGEAAPAAMARLQRT